MKGLLNRAAEARKLFKGHSEETKARISATMREVRRREREVGRGNS